MALPTAESWTKWTATFVQRLRELGWVEGRTISILYRWGEGLNERFAEIAAEFVRAKVDLIVTGGGAVPAARQATSAIPIVFAVANDPIGAGYVTSLARPGGNVTGLSLQAPDLAGKRVELLREAILGIRVLGILANVSNSGAVLDMNEAAAKAGDLGLEVIRMEIRRSEEIGPAFAAARGHADAVYVCTDGFVLSNFVRINTFLLAARLPAIHSGRHYAVAGGLISYGPDTNDLFRRAGDLVDKILRGANPGDIPVEQPTKFELVVNLMTASALGLELAPTLLARADELI